MIQREGPVPLYHQIELHLREQIESGRCRPGERLPPEGELQRLYGVSRITVRAALHRLEEDGIVSTRRGRGTFVERQAVEGPKIERNPVHLLAFEDEVLKQGLTLDVTVLSVEQCPVPERIGVLLDVATGTEVLRVRRVGRAGDAPLWTEARYFPLGVGAHLHEGDLGRASMTAFLQAIVGLPVTSSRLRITAGPATADQARLLEIAPGDAVLINEFAFYDAEGRPTEAARAVFRADRYAFSFTIPPSRSEIDQVRRFANGGVQQFHWEGSVS